MQKIHSITERNDIYKLITKTRWCVSDACLYLNVSLCKCHFSSRNSLQQTIKLKQGDLGLLVTLRYPPSFECPNSTDPARGVLREGLAAQTSFDCRRVVCMYVCMSVCLSVCLRSTGADCALWLCSLLPGHHSCSDHHNICHSNANITLTTSRLRAISSRMQCCCHSWFSFL